MNKSLIYIKNNLKKYYLLLSILYQIHSVFHICLLESYESRGKEMEAHISESIRVDNYEKYEIEKILDRKNIKSKL